MCRVALWGSSQSNNGAHSRVLPPGGGRDLAHASGDYGRPCRYDGSQHAELELGAVESTDVYVVPRCLPTPRSGRVSLAGSAAYGEHTAADYLAMCTNQAPQSPNTRTHTHTHTPTRTALPLLLHTCQHLAAEGIHAVRVCRHGRLNLLNRPLTVHGAGQQRVHLCRSGLRQRRAVQQHV